MLSRNLSNCSKLIKLNKTFVRHLSHIAKLQATDYVGDVNTFLLHESVYGFIVKQITDIPEFRIKAVYLEHEKTKAEYLHLYRNDSNNVFSIQFRTTPKDSSGMPHILEHTVLCGSDLFPVRDPFFKMLNRSLATFMNAMTGPDYTMYPFSTQNYSDFENLQRIYLDAVFSPKLSELDFMQEGWRLENIIPTNIQSDLIIKGVVYNEMKGVFSENENIFCQKLQNAILPDNTYGVVSGGDPVVIPSLTWAALKQFHRVHYHPSNCRCFSYGNFPLRPSLRYINEKYFSKYAYSHPGNTIVPRQKRWSDLKREHITCRYDPLGEPFEKQNTIAISLLVSDCTNAYETFLLQFVTELLIKGPNSAFYKSLIEPNISSGFTSSTGLDTQPLDTIFTVGLKGIKKTDFEKVETIFNRTINEVINQGFSSDHVQSVLHSYELLLKHETKNFGLNLLFSITSMWNHTSNVFEALKVNNLIDQLRNEIRNNPRYLQDIVKKYFKENTHKLILTMSSDKNFETRLENTEKQLILQKTKNLSEKEKQIIYEKGLQLLKLQESSQNISILPTLSMEDINPNVENVNKVHVSINNVLTQINKVNTNGIVYFKSVINTNELSQEQQMLLPLFCYVIGKMGTNKLNYKDFDSLVTRSTAGLNFNPHIAESLYHLHTYEPGILLSSYCLEKNLDSMWDIWSQIFTINKLEDLERFKMLVQLYTSNLTHGIVEAGHIYAMQAASSLVSASAYQIELLSGLQHITYMKRLLQTSNYKAMLKEILNITNILFDKKKMRVALNVSTESQSDILRSFENFVTTLPENKMGKEEKSDNKYITGQVWAPTDAINCQHHILNTSVYYCSKSILTAPYTSTDHAQLKVLARFLSSKYLHPELREKRGAYGSGARITSDGVLSFYTYRDPNSTETLDAFDESYDWLKKKLKDVSSQDLLEAKLGVFQTVDSPVPPGSKGCEDFLKKLSPDLLQRHRAEIMSVNKKNLEEVSEKYLSNLSAPQCGKIILGPKTEKIDTSTRKNEIWTVMHSA